MSIDEQAKDKLPKKKGSADRSQSGITLTEGQFSPDSIQDVVAANFCDLDMKVDANRSGYRTRLELVHLGQIDVLRYQSEGMQRGVRRWEHIRHDKADYVSLYMPLEMEFFVENGNAATRLSPGEFCFIATNRPFSLVQYYKNDGDYYNSIYVKVPGPLMRQRVLCIDDLCCRAFPIMPGAGSIMKKVVEAALDDGGALSAAGAAKFGAALLDVIGNAAEWAADISGSRQPARKLSQQRLVEQAKRYVEEHLSDADIDTAAIALHCHVSQRYLHSAFAASEQTVAGYVRERRLQMCRAALSDPLLADRSITRIASDWGFRDPSQFSRAYRNRFHCTPREEREHARNISEKTNSN